MSELQEWTAVKTDRAKLNFWATIRMGILLGVVVLIVVTLIARAFL
jgi:hypothetical protein